MKMVTKVSDATTVSPVIAGTLRCTETLICPTNSFPVVSWWYKFRYALIRASSLPVAVPSKFPVLGGKNIIEVGVMLLIFAAGIAVTLGSGEEGSGSVASWIAGFGVLLGLRNNPLTLVFGISFERALFWHKLVCILAISLSVIHGCLAESSSSGITLICLMGGTSVVYLAKYVSFELFYFVHILFLGGIAAVAFIHSADTFGICVLVWAFDVAIRYLLMGKRIDATATVLPGGVVRLSFPKPFEYSAGQFVFVMIPTLSQFQYHPFSISSAPHEDTVTLHIRTLGGWTKALSAEVMKGEQSNKEGGEVPIQMYLEGPYGLCSVDITDPMYKVILLISGGIGVTPTQSIFNDCLERHFTNQVTLRKCVFVWSVRERDMINSLVPHGNADSKIRPEPGNDLPASFQPDLVRVSSLDSNVARSVHSAKDESQQQSHASPEPIIATTVEDASVFHFEYYLTGSKGDCEQPDCKPYLHHGRPDFERLFAQVKQLCAVNKLDRVAVVTCGPLPMVQEVQSLCIKNSGKINFDLHVEEFGF